MTNIHLIGIGALGKHVAEELAKRAAALEKPLTLVLYDFDTVEERNVYSQGFAPRDVGRLKAEVTAEYLAGYRNVTVVVRPWKVDRSTLGQMQLDKRSIVVDAVDNLDTRHFLWGLGVGGWPVVHAGLSQSGDGSVTWNWGEYDSFILSPNNMSMEQMSEIEERRASGEHEVERKLAPCDLNAARSMILNTALCTVDALSLFQGDDPASALPQKLSSIRGAFGLMTNWTTNVNGRQLIVRSAADLQICELWAEGMPDLEQKTEAESTQPTAKDEVLANN